MSKLQLKRPDEDGYPRDWCAAARCKELSMVIDATRKLTKHDLPLCERHWGIRADLVLTKK